MNRVTLIGRLVKDPEIKFVKESGTAVSIFRMAVDDFESKDTDFITVVVWGRRAEAFVNNNMQGDLIGVDGKLKTRSYETNDGSKRFVTEVVAKEIQFCASSKRHQDELDSIKKENENIDKEMFKGTALEYNE